MKHYTIGFANLDDTQNPFTIAVRKSLEREAKKHENVTLIVRDNNMNTPTAKANAREFAELNVDLVIMFHIDERANMEVLAPIYQKQIPTISVDIPIPLTTFFGINAEKAGIQVGEALADWIDKHWEGKLDKLVVLTEYRVLDIFRKRFDYALEVLRERKLLDNDNLLNLDNGGDADITAERMVQVLKTWGQYERIGIITMNDKIAVGALRAARELNREHHVAVGSYDGTEVAIQEFQKPNSRLIVSPSFRSGAYGTQLMALALQMLKGEHMAPNQYVDPYPLTRDNYYTYLPILANE